MLAHLGEFKMPFVYVCIMQISLKRWAFGFQLLPLLANFANLAQQLSEK